MFRPISLSGCRRQISFRSFLRYSTMSKTTLTLYTASTPNGYKISPLLGKFIFDESKRLSYSSTTKSGVGCWTEELKLAYPNAGLTYDLKVMDFSIDEQKQPWFLKGSSDSIFQVIEVLSSDSTSSNLQINPNGRIPAIVHHRPDGTDFPVFESAAIILYLVQQFDPEYKFHWPAGSDAESETLQWIFFVVSVHFSVIGID